MKLILIRGLPGSGKSTQAKQLKNFTHVEADMFFELQGKYKFDPTKIKEAHAWCQNKTKLALAEGKDVVVSNTFTQHWEMEKYKQFAQEFKAELEIVTATGNWPNVHGVPETKIQEMKLRWED